MKILVAIVLALLNSTIAYTNVLGRDLEEVKTSHRRPANVEQQRPQFQANGTPYTDEQLAESNKTRYNATGKQQVSRYVESWRSPLQRYENNPGVYGTGYLGPLPNGPVDGPFCPPGFDCFYNFPDYSYRWQSLGWHTGSPSYYRGFRK